MTFNQYIGKCKVRDNPEGDFVKDSRRVNDMPQISSWADLESYLVGRGACSEAIAAGQSVWADFAALKAKA